MEQERGPYTDRSFLLQPLNHLILLSCHGLRIRRVPEPVPLWALCVNQLLAALTAFIILAHGINGTLMECKGGHLSKVAEQFGHI